MLTVRINGETWTITRRRSKPRQKYRGLCYKDRKQIYIDPDLVGSELVEVIAHELLHAHSWHVDEDAVEAYANVVLQVVKLLAPKIDADQN